MSQSVSMSGLMADLVARIEAVEKQLGMTPATGSTVSNELRRIVIRDAKQDVEKLLSSAIARVGGYGSSGFWPFTDELHGWIPMDTVRFQVNADKRTVVALVVRSGSVRLRGIAKCAPDDCFNVHIGKAIALRRALNQDVPDKYTDAPKPVKMREGHHVKIVGNGDHQQGGIQHYLHLGETGTVKSSYETARNGAEYVLVTSDARHVHQCVEPRHLHIIDDSNVDYEAMR